MNFLSSFKFMTFSQKSKQRTYHTLQKNIGIVYNILWKRGASSSHGHVAKATRELERLYFGRVCNQYHTRFLLLQDTEVVSIDEEETAEMVDTIAYKITTTYPFLSTCGKTNLHELDQILGNCLYVDIARRNIMIP